LEWQCEGSVNQREGLLKEVFFFQKDCKAKTFVFVQKNLFKMDAGKWWESQTIALHFFRSRITLILITVNDTGLPKFAAKLICIKFDVQVF